MKSSMLILEEASRYHPETNLLAIFSTFHPMLDRAVWLRGGGN
jgi:hypothetical protein